MQAAAWALFGIVYYLAMVPRLAFSPLLLLAGKGLWALTGAGVSSLLALLYRRVAAGPSPIGRTVATAVVASLVTGPVWIFALGTLLEFTSGSNVLFDASSFPFVAINHFFVLLAWSGAYLTFTFWDRARLQEQRVIEATRLARDAQLEMLRYQLNPHFLFNTLTSVRALVDIDPPRARRMISQLSEFLRYTLDRPPGEMETLEREFEVMKQYVDIEMTRFEEMLDVRLELDPSVRSICVPSFILHPLVENAIRHGEESGSESRRVTVQASRSDQRVLLTVSNTGKLGPIDRGDGATNGDRVRLGLRNVKDRLEASYPHRHTFRIFEEGEWVRAVIELIQESDARSA